MVVRPTAPARRTARRLVAPASAVAFAALALAVASGRLDEVDRRLVARLAWALRPSPRARAGALAWVCGMGVSRLVLRAHWPSDVAGGVLAGTALAVSIWGGREA